MQRQFRTYKRMLVNELMSKKIFQTGFSDVRNNKPFKYDAYTPRNAEYYERGRLFACFYDGPLVEDGRISKDAISAMRAMLEQRVMR